MTGLSWLERVGGVAAGVEVEVFAEEDFEVEDFADEDFEVGDFALLAAVCFAAVAADSAGSSTTAVPAAAGACAVATSVGFFGAALFAAAVLAVEPFASVFFAEELFAAAPLAGVALADALLAEAFFAVLLDEAVRVDRAEGDALEGRCCDSSANASEADEAAPERAAEVPLVRPRRSAAARAIPVARSWAPARSRWGRPASSTFSPEKNMSTGRGAPERPSVASDGRVRVRSS